MTRSSLVTTDQQILGDYAEMKGWSPHLGFSGELIHFRNQYGIYKVPEIDESLMHEIIAAHPHPDRFFDELAHVVSGYDKGDNDFDWGIANFNVSTNAFVLQELFTAKLPQLKEAYMKAHV